MILLEEYVTRQIDQNSNTMARKSVMLAIKAIDAYGKPLDEE